MSDELLKEEAEKKIFAAIEAGDTVLLRTTLADQPNVNIVDENLMTPLQHAAYKGNKEMVQMLLDYGADPNLCKHQHNYTALHFAGLSGNFEVCLALLMAGARSGVTNAVNRTAAQMAAFVGHHSCVAIINNYISKSEVDYYTVIQGTQTKPYLPPFLSESFHKLIMQINIHPVKVAINVSNFIGILEHLPEVKKVLELMCEKEMKRGPENNEVMSFKFHYLSYIVGDLITIESKHSSGEDEKKLDIAEVFAKKILKPNKDGTLELLEGLLKECVKQFPFRECTLFRQIVSTLTGKDPPTALSVIASAINGQRGFVDNVTVCQTCGEEKPNKKCSKCKAVQYCDRTCQKLHWHWHKKVCAKLAQETATTQNENKGTAVDAAELSSGIQDLLVQN
ncbi:ankyrin repeat and MYND domain-containing protein 2 [Asbolus verrucosus]|uniref:Ankyrin repeat and MYND domain-containing protein 2 n=1 Tax=Asbolus verrucosus TaxID=1661398 RepID=A0A482VDC9_ASBVE|nr:ankyrin repeat and MYND domain-containing protein 2 [Asbolus verrucosus]